MLIGAMLLHTLDLIERTDISQDKDDKIFRNGSVVLPNLGLVLLLYISFAEDFKETCRHNEDG